MALRVLQRIRCSPTPKSEPPSEHIQFQIELRTALQPGDGCGRTVSRHLSRHRNTQFVRGDLDLGLKWEFHKESAGSPLPALGVSAYIEFPTGDPIQQLGSGLTDYWLNFIVQKSLSRKTRVN